MAWRIVIAGGGWGCTRPQARRCCRRRQPHHAGQRRQLLLYTPLLPGAAAGTSTRRRRAAAQAPPHRPAPRRCSPLTATASSHARGHDERIEYDHLIVALGRSRTLPVPGLAEHAIGFKTLAEAIALRNHVLRTLEMAESVDDPREREKFLTYVFVGGGYAGVEGLAELQDFAADVIDLYPRCRVQGMRWLLVEASDRIMREITASLAEFTMREPGPRHRVRPTPRWRRSAPRPAPLQRRHAAHAHAGVDGGRSAPSGRGPARAAARARAHRGRRDDEGRRRRRRVGDR